MINSCPAILFPEPASRTLLSPLRWACPATRCAKRSAPWSPIATQQPQILNAVKSSEAEKSAKYMAKHLRDSRTRLLQLLQRRGAAAS